MNNRKQTGIERTLLIGLSIGLLIGFVSKRVAYGLLLGIGIAFFMMYYMKPTNNKQDD